MVKVLHLTDLHIDLQYKENTSSTCGEPLCCRENNGNVFFIFTLLLSLQGEISCCLRGCLVLTANGKCLQKPLLTDFSARAK